MFDDDGISVFFFSHIAALRRNYVITIQKSTSFPSTDRARVYVYMFFPPKSFGNYTVIRARFRRSTCDTLASGVFTHIPTHAHTHTHHTCHTYNVHQFYILLLLLLLYYTTIILLRRLIVFVDDEVEWFAKWSNFTYIAL